MRILAVGLACAVVDASFHLDPEFDEDEGSASVSAGSYASITNTTAGIVCLENKHRSMHQHFCCDIDDQGACRTGGSQRQACNAGAELWCSKSMRHPRLGSCRCAKAMERYCYEPSRGVYAGQCTMCDEIGTVGLERVNGEVVCKCRPGMTGPLCTLCDAATTESGLCRSPCAAVDDALKQLDLTGKVQQLATRVKVGAEVISMTTGVALVISGSALGAVVSTPLVYGLSASALEKGFRARMRHEDVVSIDARCCCDGEKCSFVPRCRLTSGRYCPVMDGVKLKHRPKACGQLPETIQYNGLTLAGCTCLDPATCSSNRPHHGHAWCHIDRSSCHGGPRRWDYCALGGERVGLDGGAVKKGSVAMDFFAPDTVDTNAKMGLDYEDVHSGFSDVYFTEHDGVACKNFGRTCNLPVLRESIEDCADLCLARFPDMGIFKHRNELLHRVQQQATHLASLCSMDVGVVYDALGGYPAQARALFAARPSLRSGVTVDQLQKLNIAKNRPVPDGVLVPVLQQMSEQLQAESGALTPQDRIVLQKFQLFVAEAAQELSAGAHSAPNAAELHKVMNGSSPAFATEEEDSYDVAPRFVRFVNGLASGAASPRAQEGESSEDRDPPTSAGHRETLEHQLGIAAGSARRVASFVGWAGNTAACRAALAEVADRLETAHEPIPGWCNTDEDCRVVTIPAAEVDKYMIPAGEEFPEPLQGLFFMDGNPAADQVASFAGLRYAGEREDGTKIWAGPVTAAAIWSFDESTEGHILWGGAKAVKFFYVGECQTKDGELVYCQIRPQAFRGAFRVTVPKLGDFLNISMTVIPDELFGEEGGGGWRRDTVVGWQGANYTMRRIVDAKGRRLPKNWEHYVNSTLEWNHTVQFVTMPVVKPDDAVYTAKLLARQHRQGFCDSFAYHTGTRQCVLFERSGVHIHPYRNDLRPGWMHWQLDNKFISEELHKDNTTLEDLYVRSVVSAAREHVPRGELLSQT